MSLKQRMADYGFETNADYSLPVRMLLERPSDTIRVLNVTGESGRRKTAFANALGAALNFEHVLYHDFADDEMPAPVVDEDGVEHPSIDPFDRVMSEACALSEAEPTLLILDQLHATVFARHLQIYEFVKTREWPYVGSTALASLKNLVLFVISEEPVYHSLQKLSLRVWVDDSGSGRPQYKPSDFGLELTFAPILSALADLFEELGVVPTRSEYQKIVFDLQRFVRTPDGLIQSLYGWSEGIGREMLESPAALKQLQRVVDSLHAYLGVEQLSLD